MTKNTISSYFNDVFNACEFKGLLFSEFNLFAPWGVREDDSDGILFHYFVKGSAYFKIRTSRKWISLEPGDLILLPTGRGNSIASSPGAKCESVEKILQQEKDYRVGGSGPRSEVLCGCFSLNDDSNLFLKESNIDFIHLKKDDIESSSLSKYLDLLKLEYRSLSSERDSTIDKLLSIIFIKILKFCSENEQIFSPIFKAERDEVVLRCINVFLDDLSLDYSLEDLSQSLGVSQKYFA